MATLKDRDFGSFIEIDGEWYRRTSVRGSVEGSFSPSGLKTGGKITEIAINDSTWTALPSNPLAGRNSIAIQNKSGIEIKINYDNTVLDYKGIVIDNGGERFYDITDSILLYAKSQTGNPTINIEELA